MKNRLKIAAMGLHSNDHIEVSVDRCLCDSVTDGVDIIVTPGLRDRMIFSGSPFVIAFEDLERWYLAAKEYRETNEPGEDYLNTARRIKELATKRGGT